MRFPQRVKIGAHDIELTFATHWEGSDEELAYSKYENGRIQINSELPNTRKFSVFLHEAMHMANPQLDHELLASLAEQLAQVLLDNQFIDED